MLGKGGSFTNRHEIPFIKIDYAFYSDELGLFAGSQEQVNQMITVAMRFGSGHTQIRERIANKGGRSAPTPKPGKGLE